MADDAPIGMPAEAISEVDLLTPDQVASRLQVSRNKLRLMVRDGLLFPAKDLGYSTKRWSKRELIAWVDAGCPSASAWKSMRRRLMG